MGLGEEISDKVSLIIDQANAYLEEGQHGNALVLLEKARHLHPDSKEVLEVVAIAEVCLAAAKTSCSCPDSQKKQTRDWYRILKVDEDAKIDVIRKRYRQLALLLHPDKNKHPKAETAFKFVSEAYAYLSDKRKQVLYHIERSKEPCKRCAHVVPKKTNIDRVQVGQKHAKTTKYFAEKSWEKHSDEEKLQTFRERARARVDSAAHARQERWSRPKESSEGIESNILTSRIDTRELPTFQASEHQFPSNPYWRVPFDMNAKSDVPIFKNMKEKSLHSHFRNVSAAYTSRNSKDKSENILYEESASKKFPFSEIKRNIFSRNLKETLKAHHVFSREPAKAPRNLDTLLQRFQADSGGNSNGLFQFSDTRRKSKIEEGKNSISGKTWYHRKNTEHSDTEDESEELFNWIENNSCVQDARKFQSRHLLRMKEELLRKCSYTSTNLSFKNGEEVEKSEELLKTLELLRQEAKDVAATLDKLRKSVGSEENHLVRSFLHKQFPVASGS